MPNLNTLELSPNDLLAIQQMVYGEAASEDPETMRVVAQSALNRLKSGRSKEFGGTIPDILKKGYYAVKNPNTPYKQALSGTFPDTTSKAKWGVAKKVVEAILKDQDFGEHQFYFTPDEITKLKKSKGFDFSKVKARGAIGQYKLFGY